MAWGRVSGGGAGGDGKGGVGALWILGVLAGLSFLLLEEEGGLSSSPGPSAEVRGIVLDRFRADGRRIRLSALRAVYSPDGALRLESPKLRALRGGGVLALEGAEGGMNGPDYDTLELREIRGEAGSNPPLRFEGERMVYNVETGELSGGASHFTRAGQSFTAGGFTYAPETGAKFSDGVRGKFFPAKKRD